MLPRPVDTSWMVRQPAEASSSRISPTFSSPFAPRTRRSKLSLILRSPANMRAIRATSAIAGTAPWTPTTRPSSCAAIKNTSAASHRQTCRRTTSRPYCPGLRKSAPPPESIVMAHGSTSPPRALRGGGAWNTEVLATNWQPQRPSDELQRLVRQWLPIRSRRYGRPRSRV